MSDPQDDDEGEGKGGIDVDVLRSYLSFGRRAVRARRFIVAALFSVGLLLTIAAFKFFPRSYVCKTVLLAQGEQVLEGNSGQSPFAGAESLILRHENLTSIIREIGLIRKFEERRPPLLALKDKIRASLLGALDQESKVGALVGTLESKIGVEVEGNTLSVTVTWADGKTAAEIADAAQQSYVKMRHSSELAAFQEKMSILNGHAGKVRVEVEGLAEQIRVLHEEKVAQARASASAARGAAPPTVLAPRRAAPRSVAPGQPDPELPELRERLEASKQKYAQLQADLEKRLRDERTKLSELRLRLAASHPEVVTAEQRIAMLSQEPSEFAVMRAEIKNIESDIAQRDTLGKRDPGRPSVAGLTGPGASDALPIDIVKLLDEDDTDPVLAAQLSGAVRKYGSLRDDIRSGRIDLDTAQAAFNHRYKLIVPVEVPANPTKPKGWMILLGGLVGSLLVALAIPILAELRTGIIIERWQVQQLRLPVLGELRLPSHTGDSGPKP
jgi:uncharacterized protein involved in exopolysaccharide biosynthesis